MTFRFGRFFIDFDKEYKFDYQSRDYYPVAVLEVGIPMPMLDLDYSHLEWLAAVWGFEWHKPFAPYFDEAPF